MLQILLSSKKLCPKGHPRNTESQFHEASLHSRPSGKSVWPSSYLALRPDVWTAHRCCAPNIYWQSLEQTETFSHKIISLTYWLSYTSTLLSQNSLTCSLPLARGLVLLTFKVSAPKYKNIWGLCVWQSCVWPTLPSDRTTASLNSAACQDISVRQH